MGQMFDKMCDQMNNWRWDNPCDFGNQVGRSNQQTTSLRKAKRTGERFSWYGRDDRRAKIEPPSCRQCKPGDFLAVGPLHWDGIIDEDGDDENALDPGVLSGGNSHAGDDNDNDHGEGEEDTQGGEKVAGKGMGTKNGKANEKVTEDGKGKGKGKGKGNVKGKDIVKQTPAGDEISHAVALLLQEEMSEADFDMEGQLEREYLDPEASPALSNSSDDDTNSTESDGEYDSEHHSVVDIRMEDDVDAPDGVDSDGDVDMDGYTDNEEEEDDEEEDEEKEDEEEEDKDEDDGKEPRTIGQGEMGNPWADDVDTMGDDQPIVLPEQGQELREHSPRPQP